MRKAATFSSTLTYEFENCHHSKCYITFSRSVLDVVLICSRTTFICMVSTVLPCDCSILRQAALVIFSFLHAQPYHTTQFFCFDVNLQHVWVLTLIELHTTATSSFIPLNWSLRDTSNNCKGHQNHRPSKDNHGRQTTLHRQGSQLHPWSRCRSRAVTSRQISASRTLSHIHRSVSSFTVWFLTHERFHFDFLF